MLQILIFAQVRGGGAAGEQARGQLPPEGLSAGRVRLLGVVPALQPLAARPHRGEPPRVQLRLPRPWSPQVILRRI